MTQEESLEMTRSNYVVQMEMMGYDASGNSLDMVHVVRCRDCKHRPVDNSDANSVGGMDIEFSRDSRCPLECADSYYNRYPDDDWFCANGEK